MIPNNPPPSIPQVERARESLVAALGRMPPACIAPAPNYICNAPSAASPSASFNNENSAGLHMRQLKSEIGQKMDATDERHAQICEHIQKQREMASAPPSSITFGLQEYHAPALARLAGLEHEAEKTRHQQEVAANAREQLTNLAISFFTIKNSTTQKPADADKSFITGL